MVGLIALLMLATPVKAAPKPAPTKAIAGLEIGQPMPVSECPFEKRYGVYLEYDYSAKNCFQRAILARENIGKELGADERLEMLPLVPLPRGVVGMLDVELKDLKVAKITMTTTGHESQASLLAALTEKYGKPTALEEEPVQNMMGAKFTDIEAVWNFTDLTVMLMGLSSKVDRGYIVVMTPEAAAAVKPNPKF